MPLAVSDLISCPYQRKIIIFVRERLVACQLTDDIVKKLCSAGLDGHQRENRRPEAIDEGNIDSSGEADP